MTKPAPALRIANDYRTFVLERLEFGDQAQLASHIGKSRAWVSSVLNARQRRLSPEYAPPIAEFLGLQEPERTYFLALVDIEESASELARGRALAIIRAMSLRATPEQKYADRLQILKEGMHVGIVLEMASCDGFRPDPGWIAERLDPPITRTQAARALTLLTKHELLELDGRARPESVDTRVFTPLDLHPEDAGIGRDTHRRSMALSADAAERFHPTERHMGSGVFALSEKRFDEVREQFREAFLEIIASVQVDPHPKNRVYHFTVALHPVTDYTDSGPEEE